MTPWPATIRMRTTPIRHAHAISFPLHPHHVPLHYPSSEPPRSPPSWRPRPRRKRPPKYRKIPISIPRKVAYVLAPEQKDLSAQIQAWTSRIQDAEAEAKKASANETRIPLLMRVSTWLCLGGIIWRWKS